MQMYPELVVLAARVVLDERAVELRDVPVARVLEQHSEHETATTSERDM